MSTADPTPTEIADLLDGAADYLAEHGHLKGRLHDRATGRVCANGAICGALGTLNREFTADDKVLFADARTALIYHLGNIVHHWNDKPERTADEVIQAFRDTATKLRSDEAPGA